MSKTELNISELTPEERLRLKVDRESLALSTNPQFLKIIETARKEVRAGKTISFEALQKKYGVKAPNKRIQRARKTRRSS